MNATIIVLLGVILVLLFSMACMIWPIWEWISNRVQGRLPGTDNAPSRDPTNDCWFDNQ